MPRGYAQTFSLNQRGHSPNLSVSNLLVSFPALVFILFPMAGNILSRDQLCPLVGIPTTWRALPLPLVCIPSPWWQPYHNRKGCISHFPHSYIVALRNTRVVAMMTSVQRCACSMSVTVRTLQAESADSGFESSAISNIRQFCFTPHVFCTCSYVSWEMIYFSLLLLIPLWSSGSVHASFFRALFLWPLA